MASADDRSITCVDCGEEFLFTVGEQAFYAERGLTNAPTRCKSCREKRKAQRDGGGFGGGGGYGGGRGEKQMFATTCSQCGNETEVPFQPTPGRPVLCRDCFNANKGGGSSRGGCCRSPGQKAGGEKGCSAESGRRKEARREKARCQGQEGRGRQKRCRQPEQGAGPCSGKFQA